MANLFKPAMAILGLLLVMLLGAGLAGWAGLFSGSARQSNPPATTTPAPASRPATPSPDAAAPAKTETATFALG